MASTASSVTRLLIYGFGPYRQFRENITQRILRGLRLPTGVKKTIFPVFFQRKQFIDALKKHQPEVILGLGQTARSKRVKIERRAINRRRNRQLEKPRPITPGRAERLSTTLALKGSSQVKISYNAGDYVCNYSMYVMLDYLKRRGLPTRFGFIHIPHDYNVARARRFLTKVVGDIETSRSPSPYWR